MSSISWCQIGKCTVADPPLTPFCVQHLTVASNFLRKGITPVCCTSPPLILLLIPLIRPALIPIPALCATYLPIAISLEKILGKVSSTSTNTQLAYCLIGVLTPAITGVGILILNCDIAS